MSPERSNVNTGVTLSDFMTRSNFLKSLSLALLAIPVLKDVPFNIGTPDDKAVKGRKIERFEIGYLTKEAYDNLVEELEARKSNCKV